MHLFASTPWTWFDTKVECFALTVADIPTPKLIYNVLRAFIFHDSAKFYVLCFKNISEVLSINNYQKVVCLVSA